jgi:hypothetical protein
MEAPRLTESRSWSTFIEVYPSSLWPIRFSLSAQLFPIVQHLPIMLVSALFSALVIVSVYTLFTLIHILA